MDGGGLGVFFLPCECVLLSRVPVLGVLRDSLGILANIGICNSLQLVEC